MSISGGLVGSYSQMGKTFILEDENGNEVLAVMTGRETMLTATADDIKIGKVAATEDGIVNGLDTKTYRTTQASRLILPNTEFSIPLDKYDIYNYTKFQCIISKFNTSLNDSVETDKVVINDSVYLVNSTDAISQVTKNSNTKSVDLNIINDTNLIYMVHYMTCKEE